MVKMSSLWKGQWTICGAFSQQPLEALSVWSFKMYKTEHPKLVVVSDSAGHFYFKGGNVEPGQLGFLTYMKAKLVFVDKVFALKRIESKHGGG